MRSVSYILVSREALEILDDDTETLQSKLLILYRKIYSVVPECAAYRQRNKVSDATLRTALGLTSEGVPPNVTRRCQILQNSR